MLVGGNGGNGATGRGPTLWRRGRGGRVEKLGAASRPCGTRAIPGRRIRDERRTGGRKPDIPDHPRPFFPLSPLVGAGGEWRKRAVAPGAMAENSMWRGTVGMLGTRRRAPLARNHPQPHIFPMQGRGPCRIGSRERRAGKRSLPHRPPNERGTSRLGEKRISETTRVPFFVFSLPAWCGFPPAPWILHEVKGTIR